MEKEKEDHKGKGNRRETPDKEEEDRQEPPGKVKKIHLFFLVDI